MPGDHIGRDAELVHLDNEVNRLSALLGAARDADEKNLLTLAGEAISGGTMRLREVRRVAAHMRTLSCGHEGRDDDLIALDDEVDRLMSALAAPPATMDEGIWEALPVGTNVVASWEGGQLTIVRGDFDLRASLGSIAIYGGHHWGQVLDLQPTATLRVVFTPSTDYLPEGTRVRLIADIDDEIQLGEEGSVMAVHASGYVKVDFDSLPEMIHISDLALVTPETSPEPEFREGQKVLLKEDRLDVTAGAPGIILNFVGDKAALVVFGSARRTVDLDGLLPIDSINADDVQWGQP